MKKLLVSTILLGLSFTAMATPAELRQYDLQQAQNNIRITRSAPLQLSEVAGTAEFEGRMLSTISQGQLVDLTQQLRLRNYANEYLRDGCYAKSHLISYELARIGIKHAKAIVYGQEVGDMQIVERGVLHQFQYHIAPMVLVRLSSGPVIPYVIDLSLFQGPVDLLTWEAKVKLNSNKRKLTSKIMGPEGIDPTWSETSSSLYSTELLYRFETEIDAFNFIIAREKKKEPPQLNPDAAKKLMQLLLILRQPR